MSDSPWRARPGFDMTFDTAAAAHAVVELPMTDLHVALTQAANEP